jgi:copper chaperone CopZ
MKDSGISSDSDEIINSCDLCGLPVAKKPPKLNFNQQELQFCCRGCKHVFTLLAESGLLEGDFRKSELYQTSLKLGIIGNPENLGEDDKPLQEDLKNTKELDLHIDGMWCSSCSWLIEKTMKTDTGIVHAKIIYASDTAKIFYKPDKISPDQIKKNIDKLGYKASSSSAMSFMLAIFRNFQRK